MPNQFLDGTNKGVEAVTRFRDKADGTCASIDRAVASLLVVFRLLRQFLAHFP